MFEGSSSYTAAWVLCPTNSRHRKAAWATKAANRGALPHVHAGGQTTALTMVIYDTCAHFSASTGQSKALCLDKSSTKAGRHILIVYTRHQQHNCTYTIASNASHLNSRQIGKTHNRARQCASGKELIQPECSIKLKLSAHSAQPQ